MKIVSPSYKRAGNVKTLDLFGDDLILAVHEFEAKEYKKAHPDNEIMVIPDSERGNMGKVRNWIRNNTKDRWLLMVDDDISEIGYHEALEMNPLSGSDLLSFIRNAFVMCEEADTVLWGLNVQSDPKFYREFSPFSFLSPVLGPVCGHILTDESKNLVAYDDRLSLNEDYDFALQVLHRYRKLLRFSKFYYLAGHLTDTGGCGDYRMLQEEYEQSAIFQKKWGKKVVKYNLEKSTNPIIKVPIGGI